MCYKHSVSKTSRDLSFIHKSITNVFLYHYDRMAGQVATTSRDLIFLHKSITNVCFFFKYHYDRMAGQVATTSRDLSFLHKSITNVFLYHYDRMAGQVEVLIGIIGIKCNCLCWYLTFNVYYHVILPASCLLYVHERFVHIVQCKNIKDLVFHLLVFEVF